jgi:hypothetical protein
LRLGSLNSLFGSDKRRHPTLNDTSMCRAAHSHARPVVGVSQSQLFRDLVNFWKKMPTEWLQERPNGSKNDLEIPLRRASRCLFGNEITISWTTVCVQGCAKCEFLNTQLQICLFMYSDCLCVKHLSHPSISFSLSFLRFLSHSRFLFQSPSRNPSPRQSLKPPCHQVNLCSHQSTNSIFEATMPPSQSLQPPNNQVNHCSHQAIKSVFEATMSPSQSLQQGTHRKSRSGFRVQG